MQSTAVVYLQDSLSNALNQLLLGFASYLPNITGAVLLFVVGLVIAGWLKSIVTGILKVTNFHQLISNPAIKEFLKNAQLGSKLEEVLGEIVRWLTITLFFMTSMNILGLTTVTNFLNSIFSYLPNLAASVIILLIGAILSGVLEKLTKGFIGSYDLSLSRFMGKFVSYAVMIISCMAAIRQLGIAESFIDVIFTGLVATLALAFGLAFGLGGKDIVKNILEDWYSSFKKK